jgi:hypothetical protein
MKVQLYFTKSDEFLANKVYRLISIVFPIRQVEVELILVPEKRERNV